MIEIFILLILIPVVVGFLCAFLFRKLPTRWVRMVFVPILSLLLTAWSGAFIGNYIQSLKPPKPGVLPLGDAFLMLLFLIIALPLSALVSVLILRRDGRRKKQ